MNKNKEKSKRIATGWEDDDDKKQSSIKPQQQVIIKKEEQQFKIEKKEEVKKPSAFSSINLEKQLIDNILVSTGITIKPSDNQFKDFQLRIKNLNKEQINNLLHSRLVQAYDENDLKVFQVSY